MYEREAPPHSSKTPQIFEGVFNWTMTYRRDSDIVNGYGDVYKKKDFAIEDFSNVERLSDSLDSVMKTKTKMVAWFVSNCKTKSKRGEYAEELQRFIPVDIYGGCGLLKCGRRKEDELCYEKIEKEYKFYLSFENSFCKDYVTEKFYIILRGSGDYAAIAPPHSYINVEDFRIPRDLADYLYYLHRNETAYMEYFNWRKDYFAMSMVNWLHHASSFCTLCQKLHTDKTEKVYYNITEWFYGEAQCNKGVRSVRIPPYTKFIK
ncbi:Glycoprotein 3-alpha-L-fucosyltransferase A [Armadillidium nasatum]|uniref:Fucosyltransferase n=1 Tax=Armadillidium nasatum TaxID=96803 RepID=A0A5N5SXH7_9CRUS|nr:Glycoprotein 3-alpha-L-fucosyltransferase A [Armadillidium nasatum]